MKVTIVCGPPASGKSTYSQELIDKGYVHLNRDIAGGKVIDLLPKLEVNLLTKRDVVLDNTFPTIASRKPFIEMAKKLGAEVNCVFADTSLEDSQINSLRRMYKNHGKLFLGPNDCEGVHHSVFPVAVLFKYRKESEGQKPSKAEGFDSVEIKKFKRVWGPEYKNKALILDYDDTLRWTECQWGYPTHPDEVKLLPGRKPVINKFADEGNILLGASNQSGVHKGRVSLDAVIACFERTNQLLGHKIDYAFCPHNSSPPSCYCRKPQSGMGIYFIEKHKLNPALCTFIGDRTTDETFAKRLGFRYLDALDAFPRL